MVGHATTGRDFYEDMALTTIPDDMISVRKRWREHEDAKLLEAMKLRRKDDERLLLSTKARKWELLMESDKLAEAEKAAEEKAAEAEKALRESLAARKSEQRKTVRYTDNDIPTQRNPFRDLTPQEKQIKLEEILEQLQTVEKNMGKKKLAQHETLWRKRWAAVLSLSRFAAKKVPEGCDEEWWDLKMQEKWLQSQR